METVKNNPVVTAFIALAAAVIAVLAAFGVDLTDAQTAALLGLIVPAAAVILWVRSLVTPTRKLPPQ